MRVVRGFRKRLPLDAVFIGLNQKTVGICGNFRGHSAFFEFLRHRFAPLFHFLALFDGCQRPLENISGGFTVVAAALAVKVDGVAVQSEQNRGALKGFGGCEVVGGNRLVPELLIGRNLPQEGRIKLRGRRLCFFHEFGRAHPVKLEKDVPALNLGAPPRRKLRLIGRTVLFQNVTRLKNTVFFKK